MSRSTFLLIFKFLALLVVNIDAQYQRRQYCEADGQQGTCIIARDCQMVATLLQQSREQAIYYLRRNHCGFEGSNPLVCCISGGNTVNTRPDDTRTNPGTNPNPDSLPSPQDGDGSTIDLNDNPYLPNPCGRDLSRRLLGGEKTDLDEFPWMALLEYQKPNGKTTACGGVLISKRYILTAAHCIKGKDLPVTWRLVSVRLGEYDTDTERDCIKDGEFSVTCADDTVTVGVEEQIAHEDYLPTSRDQRNDIALLRLSRDVTFTTYIKPICLPTNTTVSNKLVVAGWGKTEVLSASNIKLKLELPLTNKQQCDQTYSAAGVRLGFGQICAGGKRGKDSCRGDSGGPLMAVERLTDGTGRWTAMGVVSFGPSPCGMEGWPGVYTKVADFVPWILSKLRASDAECDYCFLREYLFEIAEKLRAVIPEIAMTSIGLLFLFLVLRVISAQNTCADRRAECINIRRCQRVIDILKGPRPLPQETLDTLRNSQCGFEGNDPKVCCISQSATSTEAAIPTPETTTETLVQTEDVSPPPDVTNHANLRLLDHQTCGPMPMDRVIGGNKTRIFEYPWMALIAYDTGRGTEFRCGGTIISQRYILTAAHCVTMLPDNLSLIGVRVGDHDISKERDCDRDINGLEIVCSEKYQDFGIESVHSHSEYNRTKLQNDIALIRLNRTVDFRPYSVRPICLPFGTATALAQKKATVTGWGATEFGPRSESLLQALLPIMTNEDCAKAFSNSVSIWYKQMCAGGLTMVDSCMGDSGGPLQAPAIYNAPGIRNKIRFVQYGVVSYGLKQCGTTNVPGVYTRVAYYMDWILNIITD
ncbi:PREDICTED: uncharacterized protein LOC106745987 [Dinoponera quadriceps]|uniref:Uncharacterized protein LOC106745987 n=1 Tax=Dinoponera quadriceps TaxID=609295 RepID=A0A6P3XGJ6_DINQU|nr:PREDICTED: uncharacterized protein LOC106745987 [Dinoponera quadriceps]